MIRGDQLRVMAISGADDLDRHAPTVEAGIGDGRTALQDAEVLFPPSDALESVPAAGVTRACQIERGLRPSSIGLPLRIEEDLVGVMVLERDASDPFPDAALPLLRLVAEFVGPAVYAPGSPTGTPEVLRDDVLDLGAGIVGPGTRPRSWWLFSYSLCSC